MIIVILGAEASGKMTIGQCIEKEIGFTLFHNHHVIDMIGTVFNKENIGNMWKLKPHHNQLIWTIWKDVLYSSIENEENLIFTLSPNFNNSDLLKFFENLNNFALGNKTKVLFVELYTKAEERLRRNGTPNRLEQKICKRNIEQSNEYLKESMDFVKYNSTGEMNGFENYLYFDNTYMLPNDVSKKIIEKIINMI